MKFHYRTGAVTTALFVELAEGFPLRKFRDLIVANGQDITNFGRAKFQAVDEFGNIRKMEGQAQKYTNHCTTTRSSSRLLERSFPDTAELQKVYDEGIIDFCLRFGYHGTLPLNREGKLYNYQVKRAGKLDMAQVEPKSRHRDVFEPANTSSSSSGNTWQSQKPLAQKEEQQCSSQERLHELCRGTWKRRKKQKLDQQSFWLTSLRSLKSSER